MKLPACAALAMALAACAALPTEVIGPERADWEALLKDHGVETAFDHPLAVTEEMRETARRLAGYGRPRDRLEQLQAALFDGGRFPFRYETRGTLTAIEAFDRREGNCLSFTNLFIALARSLDIEVRGAFPVYRGSSERDGNLIVVNTHVVAAYAHAGGVLVFDFDRTRRGPNQPVHLLEDAELTALFLNNRGVEHLRRGAVGPATRYLEGAVGLAPHFAAAWGNLAVTRRRAGDRDGALEAYRRALEVDPANPTILTNLAGLYRSLDREAEARNARAAADLRLAASHVLLVQGDLLRTEGRVEEALDLYRRARRRARVHPDPLVAIARAEMELGHEAAARKALKKALARTPTHEGALELLAAIDSEG